jgi:integrase
LLEGLDGDLWLAIATLACLGLRPWELRHLQVLDDGTVRVMKGKTHSRGTTLPRRVVPLPPVGAPAGLVAAVLAGVRAGGLPQLGSCDTRASSYLTNRLRRRPAWLALGGAYPLYSLRKAYGYRASVEHGLTPRHVAALMGHSVAVAHRYYGSTDADAAVAAARASMRSALGSGVELQDAR